MTLVRPLALILVSAAATVAVAGATTDPPVGSKAKEFPITAALNMRPTTHPFRSCRGRVVLFTWYETWYERCSEDDCVKDINALHDKYGPRGLTVLAYGAQERKVVEPFIAEKGVRFPWVLIDTPTQEQFKRDWPAVGAPWSYLIDVDGKIVWQENPRNVPNQNVMKPGTIEALLGAATAPPLLLPAALAEQQKLVEDGLWAAAKKSLEEAAAGGKLGKVDAGWAKDTAAWLGRRHDVALAHADELVKSGWWWDAWDEMNDFARKWEGLDGADKAKVKADEIRAAAKTDKAAEKDLAVGDRVLNLKGLVAKKNWVQARFLLKELLGQTKGTRYADRVAELGEAIPPK
jgi:hypothetical protein